jgi:hypothetical protein
MAMLARLFTLLWLSLPPLVPSGAVAVRLPELSQLVRAARTGDEVELERIGARFGAVRLERLAERGAVEERLAALRALTLVANGWAMLPELARLLADSQAEVALKAATAARAIAEGLSPQVVESDEVPRDVPQRAAAELLKQAARGETPAAARAVALAAAAALRAVTRIDEGAVARLITDGDAQVRRAAAEALAGAPLADKNTERTLEKSLAEDQDVQVAAAAAASLCRDVPTVAMPNNAGEQRASRLGAPARTRLRALAVDESVPLTDRLDLLACLRVNARPEDQKVLGDLAKSTTESLKRRARSLGGR